MATEVHMGYSGYCKIKDTYYLMTSSSINQVQSIEAPDVAMGEYTRHAWNWGKLEPGGSVSGHLNEHSDLWSLAYERNKCGDKMEEEVTVHIAYFCKKGMSMTTAINSLSYSVTAGDLATFTVDFIGKGNPSVINPVESSPELKIIGCSTIINWLDCSITGPAGGPIPSEGIESFSVTLNNNVQRVYQVGEGGLSPYDFPCGIQEMSGEVSWYAGSAGGGAVGTGGGVHVLGDHPPPPIVVTTIGKEKITFHAVFERVKGSGGTGLAMYSVDFQGVCNDDFITVERI